MRRSSRLRGPCRRPRPRRRRAEAAIFADLVGDLSRGQPVLRVQANLPQPADALMAIMILILATGYGLRVPIHYDLYLAGLAFLSWVTVVNLFWWAQYQDAFFLLSSVYYVYDFAILVLVFSMFQRFRDDLFVATRIALIIALVVQLVSLLVLPDVLKGCGQPGTFNNPNQLGYWASLSPPAISSPAGRLASSGSTCSCFAPSPTQPLCPCPTAMLSILAMLGFALWFKGVSTRLKLAVGPAIAFVIAIVLAQQAVLEVGEAKAFRAAWSSASKTSATRTIALPPGVTIGSGSSRSICSLAPAKVPLRDFGPGVPPRCTQRSVRSCFRTGCGSCSFPPRTLVIFRRSPHRHFMYFVPRASMGSRTKGCVSPNFESFWLWFSARRNTQRSHRPGSQPSRAFAKPHLNE